MPDQPASLPESVSRLAKFYSGQKLRHLANPNYAGLEKIETFEEFKKWQQEKLANKILIPVTVWQDLENAEKFSEIAERAGEATEAPEENEGKEKHEKHESYGPVHNKDKELREKYRKIIDEERKAIEKSTGQQFEGETFISDTVVNPEVKKHLPNYHASALEKFKELHGEEEYKQFLELEERTIYRDSKNELAPEADPAFAETNKVIDKKATALIAEKESEIEKNAKSTYAYSQRRIDKDKLRQQATLEEYVEFVKKHPEKAAVYAEKNPSLAKAISIVAATEKALSQKEFASELARQQAEKAYISQEIELVIVEIEEQPGGINEMQVPEEEAQITPPPPQPSYNIPPTNPLPYNDVPPEDMSSDEGSPGRSARRRGGAPSNFLKNQLLSRLPGPFSTGTNPESIALQAQNFIPPQAKIALFIILGIAVFVALVLVADSQLPNPDQETDQPVSIDKRGPDKVNNNDLIPYDIYVSYPGTATNIVVTDPIPDKSEFVSATGVYTCEPSPCGPRTTVVTWYANQQDSIVPPSGEPPSTSPPHSDSGFDQAKFERMGFPPPQDPNPIVLDAKGLERWKSGAMQAAIKASGATGVDVGIIGFWSFYEGINYDATYDNCNKEGSEGPAGDSDMNTPCGYTNWQVGNGIRPAEQVSVFDSAFKAMYGNSDTATVQRVGQGVIDTIAKNYATKITYPSSTFPNISLQSIQANMGDMATRTWAGHLTRDDGISMYILASIFRGSAAPDPSGFADSLMYDGGCASCFYNKQRIINTIKAVYDAGLSGGGGSSFPPLHFQLTVKPKENNIYIINQASAQVIK